MHRRGEGAMARASELDRSPGAGPLYHQISDILKKQIEEGTWEIGQTIPGEHELIDLFGVSRTTVRQAIALLTNIGYLKGERGRGTVVTFSKINEPLKEIVSFFEEMKRHGVVMESSLCTIEKTRADAHVARQMGGEEGMEVYLLRRVRCTGGTPLVYSATYLTASLPLSLDADRYRTSLYAYLRTELAVVVSRAHDVLEAIDATAEIMGHLNMAAPTAVFKRTRKAWDQEGRQIEFSLSYYPGQRYKYNVDL